MDGQILLAYIYCKRADVPGQQDEARLKDYAQAIKVLSALLRDEPNLAIGRDNLAGAYHGRAEALERLRRPAEAAADWGRLAELQSGPLRVSTRQRQVESLARDNQAAAAAVIADITKSDLLPPEVLYRFAKVCASAAHTTKDADLKSRAAAQAIELLTRAEAADFFRVDSHRDGLKSDPDLKSLHEHAAYRDLVRRVQPKPDER